MSVNVLKKKQRNSLISSYFNVRLLRKNMDYKNKKNELRRKCIEKRK